MKLRTIIALLGSALLSIVLIGCGEQTTATGGNSQAHLQETVTAQQTVIAQLHMKPTTSLRVSLTAIPADPRPVPTRVNTRSMKRTPVPAIPTKRPPAEFVPTTRIHARPDWMGQLKRDIDANLVSSIAVSQFTDVQVSVDGSSNTGIVVINATVPADVSSAAIFNLILRLFSPAYRDQPDAQINIYVNGPDGSPTSGGLGCCPTGLLVMNTTDNNDHGNDYSFSADVKANPSMITSISNVAEGSSLSAATEGNFPDPAIAH